MTPGQFTCRKCGGVFDSEHRYRASTGHICKPCCRAQCRTRYVEHREQRLESAKLKRAQYRAKYGLNISTEWSRSNVDKRMASAARGRAKKRGYPCTLTASDIKLNKVCPAFGVLLIRAHGRQAKNTPSLDKIIPSEGYVPNNICVISHAANIIKSDATPDEILSVALYAYTATGHTLPDIHAKVNEIAQRQVEYAKINAGTETMTSVKPRSSQEDNAVESFMRDTETFGSPASVCSVHSNPLIPLSP